MNDINMCRVVHDLKLPVYNVSDAVSIVKTLTDDPDVLKMLELIDQSCLYMKRSIGTLFDLVQLKDYNVRIEYSARSISEFINEYILWIMPVLESKNIVFEHRIKVEKDEFVCDYDMLIKVLNNLIGNAIKYNDKEEKRIKLVVGQSGENYAFSVEDNGIGIPSEEIELLMGCHYRASNANLVSTDGNGLGLNLINEIVRKLNGNVKIKSTLGVGSKFTVTLPEGTVTTLRSESPQLLIMRNYALEEFFLC